MLEWRPIFLLVIRDREDRFLGHHIFPQSLLEIFKLTGTAESGSRRGQKENRTIRIEDTNLLLTKNLIPLANLKEERPEW